jgi:hypothetical protein
MHHVVEEKERKWGGGVGRLRENGVEAHLHYTD